MAQLDSAHALSYFVAKFPYGSKKSYISYCEKATNKSKKMLENMNDWLTKERSSQLTMADLLKLEHGDDAPKKPSVKCTHCNKTGHKSEDCYQKKKKNLANATGGTGAATRAGASPGLSDRYTCPVCQGKHTYPTKDGKKLGCVRLSSCDTWKTMSIEERARHIKERNGCIICLDRTGQHQSATCVHKGKWKTWETS